MKLDVIGKIFKSGDGWVISVPKKYAELLGFQSKARVIFKIDSENISHVAKNIIEIDDEPSPEVRQTESVLASCTSPLLN